MSGKHWQLRSDYSQDVPLLEEDQDILSTQSNDEFVKQDKIELSQIFKMSKLPEEESLRKVRQKARNIVTINKANNKVLQAEKQVENNIENKMTEDKKNLWKERKMMRQ